MWHSLVHLLHRSLNLSVGYFSTSKLAISVAIAAFLLPHARVWWTQDFKSMLKQMWRDLGLGGALVLGVWLCVFGWSLTEIVYTDHQALVGANASLKTENGTLRNHVADLNSRIAVLENSPQKTITRILPAEPSGSSKPDRVLTDREKDHLYEGLKKLADDPKYRDLALVTIAPYASQDRESLRLTEQLAGVFGDAHWKVLMQNQLPIKLVGRAQHQIPIGIWILTNHDSNFRYFIWSNLKQVGLDSDERPASDLPPDFNGLIIWVGYKDAPF